MLLTRSIESSEVNALEDDQHSGAEFVDRRVPMVLLEQQRNESSKHIDCELARKRDKVFVLPELKRSLRNQKQRTSMKLSQDRTKTRTGVDMRRTN